VASKVVSRRGNKNKVSKENKGVGGSNGDGFKKVQATKTKTMLQPWF